MHELRAGTGADVVGADVVGADVGEDVTGADVVGEFDDGVVDEALLVGTGVDGLVAIGGVRVTAEADGVPAVDGADVLGPDGLLDAVQAPSESTHRRPIRQATACRLTCRSADRSSRAGC